MSNPLSSIVALGNVLNPTGNQPQAQAQRASKQLTPRVGGHSGVMRCLEEVQMESQDLGAHVQGTCKQEAARGDKGTTSFM